MRCAVDASLQMAAWELYSPTSRGSSADGTNSEAWVIKFPAHFHSIFSLSSGESIFPVVAVQLFDVHPAQPFFFDLMQ